MAKSFRHAFCHDFAKFYLGNSKIFNRQNRAKAELEFDHRLNLLKDLSPEKLWHPIG